MKCLPLLQIFLLGGCCLDTIPLVFGGTACFSCNDVTQPGHCTTIETCGHHEICYAREYTDGTGSHAYRLGCESEEICNVYHNAMNIFGRRDVQDQANFCFECCRSDQCNKHLCTGSTYVSSAYQVSTTHRPFYSSWYLFYHSTQAPVYTGWVSSVFTTPRPIYSTWYYPSTPRPIYSTWYYPSTPRPIYSTRGYASTPRPIYSTWYYPSTPRPIYSTWGYASTPRPVYTEWTSPPHGHGQPWTVSPTPNSDNSMLQTLACHFNKGMCWWRNSNKDNADWILHHGPTKTSGTGPSTDVSGNGKYVYMEAKRPGETTMLESPNVLFSSSVCLHFWYHMHGADVGSLSLLMENANGYVTLWKVNGDQGNQWNQARVQLPYDHTYTLTFYAMSGSGYQGDIALDDISTVHGRC